MNGIMYPPVRLLLAAFLGISLAISAGCGSSSKPNEGTVKGKVMVNGVAANSDNVLFTLADGKFMAGAIQADGTYNAIGVPLGAAQVTVIGPPPAPSGVPLPNMGKDGPVAPGMSAQSKPIPIPAKYGKAATSGLTYTVKSGANTYDIDLK